MKNKNFHITVKLVIVIIFFGCFVVNGQTNFVSEVSVSTNFVSGGGTANVIDYNPVTIFINPHNEGAGGWGQVWWYFKVEGLTIGEQVVLQLENGPGRAGIAPRVFFSYDNVVWGLTDNGKSINIDGKSFFKYQHTVRGEKVWFAYDLPYTPDHMEKLLFSEAKRDPGVEVLELCKTKNNRPVMALRFNGNRKNESKKYGIWLQAREHAFETGGSWVVHELAKWLLSGDPAAKTLRNQTVITLVPIVDVDAVVEGRTGKNQVPYDHNREWDKYPSHWVEVRAIQSQINEFVKQNRVDLFIDCHGPGASTHPYFIVPFSDNLFYEKQRINRAKFFEILDARPFDDRAKNTQSMTQFFVSERPWDKIAVTSSKWVDINANQHSIALTLEVNMGTPLSTQTGYQAEALVLGRAISEYFTNDYHIK